MNEQQYKDKLEKITHDFNEDKGELEKTYAMANNDVEIGDIVLTPRWIIKVESISVGNPFGVPGCKYHGQLLKKDLTPHKNSGEETAHQCNVESILKRMKYE